MTLLFIENRYKTFLYVPIANKLSKYGYTVHWLVQNKQFSPKGNFELHPIKYPTTKLSLYNKDEHLEDVIKSDRQQNHFKKKDSSYFYYYSSKIAAILDNIKPDIVFGEATAFHELLTIHHCKKRGILYLNPSTCRYPMGRFSFYKYNTLEPYKGSGDILEPQEAINTVNAIVNRTVKPDYMKAVSISNYAKIKDKITLITGYLKGERFNTPNPIIKFKLEQQKKQNIAKWNRLAALDIKTDKFTVLYPLQMQPEANIDVWGQTYRNQSQLIKQVLKALPKDAVLVVKPNPKSKYELNEVLIDLVQKQPNCIALHHSTKMDDVLPKTDLVLTVTGTIAIECILSNKPVVTLIKTINNTAKNCVHLNNITKIKTIIEMVRSNRFETLTINEKAQFINTLNSTSYKGVIADPFNDANCINNFNLTHLETAFLSVL